MERMDFDYRDGTDNSGYSCPLIVNGTIILFGGTEFGSAQPRQVSVISPFSVKRINTLPFDFNLGRCHFNNGKVFLCFDMYGKNLCQFR